MKAFLVVVVALACLSVLIAGATFWALHRQGVSESAWMTLQDVSEAATAQGSTFTTEDIAVQGHWRVVWTCERHATTDKRPGACQIQAISKDGKWGDIVANTQGNDAGIYQGSYTGILHIQVFANQEAWRIQIQQAP